MRPVSSVWQDSLHPVVTHKVTDTPADVVSKYPIPPQTPKDGTPMIEEQLREALAQFVIIHTEIL